MLRTLPLLAALALVTSGCATKDFVEERLAATNGPQDARLDEHGLALKSHDSRLNSLAGGLDSTSATARDALERANAAGKLAAGKFLYEVVLTDGVSFQSDSSTLTRAARAQLAALADKLKAENQNVYLEIQGHTDNRGSTAGNLALGQRRADAVRHFLGTEGGVPLHRMNTISYGEAAPVASNRSRAGRSTNRRVAVVILQ